MTKEEATLWWSFWGPMTRKAEFCEVQLLIQENFILDFDMRRQHLEIKMRTGLSEKQHLRDKTGKLVNESGYSWFSGKHLRLANQRSGFASREPEVTLRLFLVEWFHMSLVELDDVLQDANLK